MGSPMNIADVIKAVARLAVYPLLLFGAAGTLFWPEAWVFLVVFFLFAAILLRMLLREDPGLLKERVSSPFQEEQKGWDRVFMLVFVVVLIVWLPLMGVDAVRFHWSQVPLWLKVVGALGLISSLYVSYRTFRENAYLSAVVKIQKDRGHHVVSTGPYAYVRHPMYAALLILFPSQALLLGSWYGLALSAVLMLLLVIRTRLEDRTLREELDGYAGYAARVRYRLIPGIW